MRKHIVLVVAGVILLALAVSGAAFAGGGWQKASQTAQTSLSQVQTQNAPAAQDAAPSGTCSKCVCGSTVTSQVRNQQQIRERAMLGACEQTGGQLQTRGQSCLREQAQGDQLARVEEQVCLQQRVAVGQHAAQAGVENSSGERVQRRVGR